MQTMHLLLGVAIQPNLEFKTRPKPVLGSLPLAFALPGWCQANEALFILLDKSSEAQLFSCAIVGASEDA